MTPADSEDHPSVDGPVEASSPGTDEADGQREYHDDAPGQAQGRVADKPKPSQAID